MVFLSIGPLTAVRRWLLVIAVLLAAGTPVNGGIPAAGAVFRVDENADDGSAEGSARLFELAEKEDRSGYAPDWAAEYYGLQISQIVCSRAGLGEPWRCEFHTVSKETAVVLFGLDRSDHREVIALLQRYRDDGDEESGELDPQRRFIISDLFLLFLSEKSDSRRRCEVNVLGTRKPVSDRP